jgi:hypothetical protein
MQILYTYTKLPVYMSLQGEHEHMTVPNPPAMHHWEPPVSQPSVAAGDRPVTWVQTGKFIECNGCIVIQWRGTFDHERKTYERETKERRERYQQELEEINNEFEENFRDSQ